MLDGELGADRNNSFGPGANHEWPCWILGHVEEGLALLKRYTTLGLGHSDVNLAIGVERDIRAIRHGHGSKAADRRRVTIAARAPELVRAEARGNCHNNT